MAETYIPTWQEAKELSQLAYTSGAGVVGNVVPDGWTNATDSSFPDDRFHASNILEKLQESEPLFYETYLSLTGLSFTVAEKNGTIALVFEGTDSLLDVGQDLVFGAQLVNGQGYVAARLGLILKDLVETSPNYSEVIAIGHSLGGANAQFAGAAAGLKTLTFDNPGIKNELSNLEDQLGVPAGTYTNEAALNRYEEDFRFKHRDGGKVSQSNLTNDHVGRGEVEFGGQYTYFQAIPSSEIGILSPY